MAGGHSKQGWGHVQRDGVGSQFRAAVPEGRRPSPAAPTRAAHPPATCTASLATPSNLELCTRGSSQDAAVRQTAGLCPDSCAAAAWSRRPCSQRSPCWPREQSLLPCTSAQSNTASPLGHPIAAGRGCVPNRSSSVTPAFKRMLGTMQLLRCPHPHCSNLSAHTLHRKFARPTRKSARPTKPCSRPCPKALFTPLHQGLRPHSHPTQPNRCPHNLVPRHPLGPPPALKPQEAHPTTPHHAPWAP